MSASIDLVDDTVSELLSVRSNGVDPRLEVWYLTASDSANNSGLWIHYELVTKEDQEIYLDGWLAYFQPNKEPLLFRSGRIPVDIITNQGKKVIAKGEDNAKLIKTKELSFDGSTFEGHLDGVDFEISIDGVIDPIYTFAKWSWEKETLPASQIVPIPKAKIKGEIHLHNQEANEITFSGVGGLARIFGHGSAKKWAWLHAHLDDDTVLEAVVAQPKTPALSLIRPLAFIQLKRNEDVWPKDPITASMFFKAKLNRHFWTVKGRIGRRRLIFEVSIPEDNCVKVGYVDPDGSTATCVNSEVSSVMAILQRRFRRWETQKVWHLQNIAHAEYGDRP